MAYMDEMAMVDQGNGNMMPNGGMGPGMPPGMPPPQGGMPPGGGMPQGPEAEVQELLMLRDQIDQRFAELGMPVGGPANDPMAGMAPPPMADPMAGGGMMPPPAPGLLG